MKRDGGNLFANFFSMKDSEKGGTSRKVLTTTSAQPHVLREKMTEMKLTHGETVMVNMSPVRLDAVMGKMYLYFCPMKTLDVVKKLTEGDGGEIPEGVVVEGLTFPKEHRSGLYTLKNVKLSSNGAMQVTATDETTWESAESRPTYIVD